MSKFLGLAVAGFATLVAAQASAATSTQTFFTGTSPFTTGPAVSQSFPFTNNLSVATFNATTGNTLNSVTITLSGNITVSTRVTNVTADPVDFTNARASTPVSVSIVTGGTTTVVTNTTYSAGPNAGTVNGNSILTAGTVVTPISSAPVSVSTAPFIGNGATPITLQFAGGAVTASGVGVDDATFFGGRAFANATLTVTYDFTEAPPPPVGVPEPASLALLGLGLAGVGMVRRRRA